MNDDDYKSYFMKKKRWTENEKRVLLKGLKKYGSQNVNKLKPLLPHKSTNAILQMIRKYQTIAELGRKDINSPLDVWLRSGIFSGDNILISEALLFIYLFENHPPSEETAGFDIKQAYKFLYEATKGHPMTNLSRRTTEMFKQLILTVDEEIWPADGFNTTDYLIGKLCTVESEKCYKRKRLN